MKLTDKDRIDYLETNRFIKAGETGPFAAYYFGPFYVMGNVDLRKALDHEILSHRRNHCNKDCQCRPHRGLFRSKMTQEAING